MSQIDNNIDARLMKRKITYLILTALVGILLIAPKDIMWAKDRENYLVYARDSFTILKRSLSKGFFPFLLREPLFLLINVLLGSIFSPEIVIKIIIFVSSFGVLYSLGKISGYNLKIIFFFLFVPQIVKNHITHLRQGLGLSLYLMGLTSDNKYGRAIRYLSVFIHTSFAFIILFEILDVFLKKAKLVYRKRLLVSSFILYIFIFALPKLSSLLGDRRAMQYNFTMAESATGLGFILWLLVGTFFILFIEENYNSTICSYGIVFYLISYFHLDFGARIFENIVPLILGETMSGERNNIEIIFTLFFLLYGLIQWHMRGGLNF